jgi:cell division protein FtsB
MKIGCCELALVGLIVNVISLAIYAGYNIKLASKQLELEKQNGELKKELAEIERVNGKEKQAIKDLQQQVQTIVKKFKKYE